jgi:hypothetical protein
MRQLKARIRGNTVISRNFAWLKKEFFCFVEKGKMVEFERLI